MEDKLKMTIIISLRVQCFPKIERQLSKFILALGNCQGFCQGKSVFPLMCIGKLLPRHFVIITLILIFE